MADYTQSAEFTNQAAKATGNAIGAADASRTVADYLNPQSIASRQEARVASANSTKALQKAQQTQYTPNDLSNMSEQQSLEIQDAKNQAKIANLSNARMTAYLGFQQFEADHNPEHINEAFKTLRQNPISKNLFDGIVRLDKIGPGDEQLLKPLGITYEQFASDPKLNGTFLRGTDNDGNPMLVPMEVIYGATGYNRYQTNQQLEEQKKRADILYRLQAKNAAGNSAAERIAHTMTVADRPANIDEKTWKPGNPEYDAAYIENYQNNRDKPTPETQSEAEATRQTLLDKPASVSEDDWSKGNHDFDVAYQNNFKAIRQRETQTSAQKEQTQVSGTRDKINQMAEKDGKSFFDIDFGKRENRLKYEQPIQDMMRLGKMPFSNEDKRTAGYIHQLMDLGDTASGMTDQQAGAIDGLVRNVKNYVSNNATGLDMTSAYSAFRNTIRHALFGSALTTGEIESFNEQFGNLKQQTGPILAQFETGLKQIKSQLESMMNLGDSYVTHYYLGADDQQLHKMIDAIDERIQAFGKIGSKAEATISTNSSGKSTVKSAPATNERPPLNDIYNNVYKPTGN